MFKNSPMKNITSHRNQTMNLRYKSIDWFLPDLSLHQKGLLKKPTIQESNSLQTNKYDLRATILRKLVYCLEEMYKSVQN